MKTFIDYWDEVIREWTKGDGSVKDVPQTERVWFDKTKTNLISEYMPEPYIGDPENCSAVVINYNPGGDDIAKKDAYCHISQVAVEGSMPNIMGNRYRELALDLPWLKPSEQRPAFINERMQPTINWLENRKKWVDELLDQASDSEKAKMPFFIDICGWHSKNWKGVRFKSNSRYDATPLIDYLKQHILPVLMYAIPKSQLGIGLCVGKQFAEVILPALGFKAITDPEQPKPEKHRYFQAFENKGVKILCTWSWGSNKCPAEKEYKKDEKDLILRIRTK